MTYASWSPIATALLGGAAFGSAMTFGVMRSLWGVRLRLAVREVELRSSAVQARLRAAHIQALADLQETHRASKQTEMLAIDRERARQARAVSQPHPKRHRDADVPAFADTQPMLGEFDIPPAVGR